MPMPQRGSAVCQALRTISVGECVDGRACGRGDIGRRVVVMRVRDRHELRPAADREDVAVLIRSGAHQRSDPGANDGACTF